jgi:hypothetical protein
MSRNPKDKGGRRMNNRNKWIIALLVLFLMIGGVAAGQAQEGQMPQRPKGRMKPPQEAIKACSGKSEGATVQFTTMRGDTLKGVCKTVGGVLAAVPERGTPPRPEGRMTPPAEAINVCKGKSEGTAVQFTTAQGDTLKGVCRKIDGVLAAVPAERGTPPAGGQSEK